MKKLILSGLILATISITIIGCNKEKVETVNENISTRKIDYTLDQIPLLENKQDINQLMLNPNDKDEEKLNNYLYEIGLATKDLIKNEEFNQTIIGMAKKSDNQTAYLLDLKTEAPIFFNIINENLAKNNLSLERIAEDMTHNPLTGNPEYPVTMEIEKYVPAIFIPNLNALDDNKQPLLSPNVETDCSQDSEIEDFIITWYFDKNGNQHEIILGEQTSLKTTNPLFLIDHAIPKKKENSIIIVEENRPDNLPSVNEDDRVVIDYFESREIQIKPGYGQENGSLSNKSEFCVSTHRLLYNNGSPYGYPIFSNKYLKIKEIHPNQFGTDQYVPAYHCDNWTPYSQNRIYWNTYERDWNRGNRDLIIAPYWGVTLFFQDRMRYSSDWYAWIPATTNIHNTPLNWFGWETSVRFENWKTAYELYRVE